jgi:hypothetical protein
MEETGAAIYNWPLNKDGYIQKLDADGNFIWAKQLKNPYSTVVHSIVVDINNNVYTSGVWQGSPVGIDFDPGPSIVSIPSPNTTRSKQFIHKLNEFGEYEWVNTFGPWYLTPDYLNPEQGGFLSLNSNNDLYYAGDVASTDTTSFSFGGETYLPKSQDILLAKINTEDGSVAWSSLIGGTGPDNVYATDIVNNRWIISGTFENNVDFCIDDTTGFPLVSNGSSDFFIMRIGFPSNITTVEEAHQQSLFTVYPNPTTGIINIENNANAESEICLYNTAGKLISTEKSKADILLNIESHPPGTFILTIKTIENKVFNSTIYKR